jgi:hypothetical protein
MIRTKQSAVERRQLANGLTVITERRGLGPVVFAGNRLSRGQPR